MKLNSLLFTLSLLFFTSLNAQTEVNAVGGSFEELVPWGDGYLGIIQTQAYAIMPKYRQFQYFDENGDMKWNEKITPFNFVNASVCHSESEYAYFVNMPFTKTAIMEKSSKTELLNLYQIDRSGRVTEKEIKYTGVLKPLADYVKRMNQTYLGAYKDGIIFVGTNDFKKHHIVKIDHDFNITYNTVDFEWDEKLWSKNGLSQVKYVLGENEFSLIQMKHKGEDIITTIKTIDLNTFKDVKVVKNNINFSGYTLNSKSGYDIQYSAAEYVFTDYKREVWRGDNLIIYPTLGSFTNYVYTNDGLKMYVYYKNIKENTRREVEKEGFLMYNMNTNKDIDVKPLNEFQFESEKTGSQEHAFNVAPNGKFIFISKQSKSNIILRSSENEEMKFDENLSFSEVYLSYLTGVTRSKSDAIDVICITGVKYTGIDFEGFKNTFGNSKKALIYRY